MSTRRGFLKQAIILAAGASIITPAVTRAVEHLSKYHPEVQAVLNRFPDPLEDYENEAIANFIVAEIDNGNWQQFESFQMFGLKSESNALVNWKI